MKEKNQNEAWELIVGKMHNSLDEREAKLLSELEETSDLGKEKVVAKRIHEQIMGGLVFHHIDKEKQWKIVSKHISQSSLVFRWTVQAAKYAAVFVVALIAGILLNRVWQSDSDLQALNTVEVEWGHMSKITLSEGTQVWLNAGTTFGYPSVFNKKLRQVKLNGEAQFKVTKNSEVPFEVATKTGLVRVYGTTFNVSSYDEDPEFAVTLIEGKVGVENTNGKLISMLELDEQITINKETGQVKIRKVDTDFYNYWIDGKIYLEKMKLKDLSKILQRWYNVDITIRGKETANVEISGTILKGKSLELFLMILDRLHGVKHELKLQKDKRDELIIYKK